MSNQQTFGPAFFAMSGRREFERGGGFVSNCLVCGREISAPMPMQRKKLWCLYCGMERGKVPMIEIRARLEYTCGITQEECDMINGWLDAGNDIDHKLMERAKKLGQG